MANIYDQTDTSSLEVYSDVNGTRQLISAGASIIGKVITKMSIYLSKSGSGTLSTNPEAKFYDASTATSYSFGTIAGSSVTTSPVLYEFPLTPSLPAIESGDYVEIIFPAGQSPELQTHWSTGSVYSDQTFQYRVGTTWYSRTGDLSAVWAGTGDTGSTRLPPPPLVAYF